jgi:hypothetical protein
MSDLRARFDALNGLQFPDIWDEIDDRATRSLYDAPSEPVPTQLHGPRRLMVAVFVLAISTAAIVWAVVALSNRQGVADHPEPEATNTFTLPPPGGSITVVPELLTNGRPIFIVERGTRVWALDATSSNAPFGIRYLVSWCVSSETFVDLFQGTEFTPVGSKLVGPGGPSLLGYQVSRVPGSVDAVRVGAPTNLGKRRSGFAPTGPFCTDTSQVLVPRTPDFLYRGGQAIGSTPSRWVSIRGTLLVTSDSALLCPNHDLHRGRCTGEGMEVIGINTRLMVRLARSKGISPPLMLGGHWIATPGTGGLYDLTRVPGPTTTTAP